jgi:hypothetical protein
MEPSIDHDGEQAVAWMAEGKHRNWKYENC